MWFQKRNGVKQQPTAQAEQQDLPHDKGQQQMRSDDIITALSADYHTILQVDTKTDEVSCIRRHGTVDIGITEKDTISYREWSAGYAARVVTEDDRPAFIRFTDPESMLTGIQNGHAIIHRYRINRNGKDSFEQLKVVAVPSVGEDLHKFGLAFSDIDKESRDTIERINTLSTALADTEKAARPDGAFLSRMSHDIRTPMNAIIGLNTLALNDDTISARTRNYLEKIGESAQHLLGLINDILDMSRIESGRMTLHKQEFALKSLIEQVNNTIKAK